MNERIFEQAIRTLGLAYMAGRALVAIGIFQKKKGPPLPAESRKALEEALAFVKKAGHAEEASAQRPLNPSSLESLEAYTIALNAVRAGEEDVLRGRSFNDFLKSIEGTIEELVGNGNVGRESVEAVRVFFSRLMHITSSQGTDLLEKR